MKVLAPKIAAKAIQTFDRATVIVVGACWAAAILVMIFAIYATTVSVSAKREADEAMAVEPALPKITRKGVEVTYAQTMLDRLKRLYPDVGFSFERENLIVTAVDGARFREWLTAVSYVDTISPDYHWSIKQFCVGKCGGEIMHAVLIGEHISFEMPKPDD
jgi:hypothetical protein